MNCKVNRSGSRRSHEFRISGSVLSVDAFAVRLLCFEEAKSQNKYSKPIADVTLQIERAQSELEQIDQSRAIVTRQQQLRSAESKQRELERLALQFKLKQKELEELNKKLEMMHRLSDKFEVSAGCFRVYTRAFVDPFRISRFNSGAKSESICRNRCCIDGTSTTLDCWSSADYQSISDVYVCRCSVLFVQKKFH